MTSTTQLTPLRYATPTVTLEVMVRAAAVSRWSERPVVQILRYQIQVRSLSDEEPPVELHGDRDSFLPLMWAVQTYVRQQLSGEENASDRAPNSPFLEAHGLTRHTLHLGDCRTQAGAASVVLGAVQLADFDQVLDQLEMAVRPLPLSLAAIAPRRAWRRWGAIAASMVAAVGITTTLWSNYQPQPATETALEAPTADSTPVEPSARLPQSDDTSDESAAVAVPEAAEDSTDADASSLPTAKPPSIDSQTLTDRRAKTDATPPAASAPAAETLSADAPAVESPSAESADASSGRIDNEIASAEEATADGAAAVGAPADSPSGNHPVAPAIVSNEPAEGAPAPVGAAPPAPPARSATTADADLQAAETFSDDMTESLTLPGGRPLPAAPAGEPESVPGTLADLVQQVRDRWNPTADLDQTLTYTLTFAFDGTLVEVVSADALAADYLEQTGIPAVGSEWLTTREPHRILLLLHPNGDVELKDAEPF